MKRSKLAGDEQAGASWPREAEEFPLRPRAHDSFVEAQVLAGDTLQAIALRFHCQISELKRINQIHKDNEIFARRTIKIPVTPYSILTEVLPAPPPPVAPETVVSDHVIDYNAAILNSNIAPAVLPYTDEVQEQTTENTLLIAAPKHESVEAVVVKELTSHGADFGIKWHHLLLCVLLLGFVIPLVYILFYVQKEVHVVPVSHPPH